MTRKWWKEEVIYQIYPRSFKDSNGDGIGDIQGIISKLDYLSDLGIDIVWLSPVYRSPNDDNGYDISDYYDIHPEFGTMADFDLLLQGLHDRGIRLLMDLVVNHSSDEHQWFQESRKSRDNPYRDFYFWRPGKNGGPPSNLPSFFGGSAWAYDELTEEYYLHIFTKKQPDLNWENQKVREEVYTIMRFWLDKGVDGFRMDVIPLISKNLDFPEVDLSDFSSVIHDHFSNGPRVHEFLQEMHREVLHHYDCMTVGEGPGITMEIANDYVGEDRKEINMIFHLDHMLLGYGPQGKMDLVPTSFTDFKDLFSDWYQVIGEQGWINIFLDNHDFARMVSRWGDDDQYRKQSAKMLAILIMTLRGTPCIYNGSEIGMTNVYFDDINEYKDVETWNFYREHLDRGEDPEAFLKIVHRVGRDNARTPMQWDDSKHAGFTSGQPWIKVNPNYSDINVEEAQKDNDSILKFYQHLLSVRKAHPTWVYGAYASIDHGHDQIFAYKRWDADNTYYIVLNFSEKSFDYIIPEMHTTSRLLGNYPKTEIEGDAIAMKPWEGVVFQAESE
ncbi:MAG: alpha-glucosidase [Bacteroidia bacterium]|nr:alpha-glucosidase [Bacteroidia bacterium]